MTEPSRLAVWRAAAIGGFATTFAAIIDERVLVAYGTLLVMAVIFVGIIRDLGEARHQRWLRDPKTWAGLGQEEDDMCPNCVTPWKCNGPHEAQRT